MRGGQVSQGPGHDVGGVEDLHHGEVAQEEVHGRQQGGADLCEEDDQGVAQQGDQVDQKHHPEQGALQGLEVRESQKEECRQSLIRISHHFRLGPVAQPIKRSL